MPDFVSAARAKFCRGHARCPSHARNDSHPQKFPPRNSAILPFMSLASDMLTS